MGNPLVALVLVSHSRALAEGVVELAGQMAPDVALVAAGGTDDDGLGTGFDRVQTAMERALADGRSAVVLTDLGSAVLTVESVLEMLDPDVAARVRLADAPFVEGAVEAAVAAQGGVDLDAVLAAARHAGATFAAHGPDDDVVPGGARARGDDPADSSGAASKPPAQPDRGAPAGDEPVARGTAVLRNRLGLHARPAASLARTASAFDSRITVNGADARSILALVGLGATGGDELVVAASGPDARTAVNAVVAELEEGFGEA